MGRNCNGRRCADAPQSKSCRTKRCKTVLLAAMGTVLAAPVAALATAYNWNLSGSGLFDVPANWSPAGPPALSGDTTFFGSVNTYTVTFAQNRTNASSLVDNGNVT